MLCASGSHLLLKALLNETGLIGFNWSSAQSLYSQGRTLRILMSLAMLIAGFVLWIMSLNRLNISYAYPVACSSTLLITFFSVFFLNEAISMRMWTGTIFIVLGTILLVPSQ